MANLNNVSLIALGTTTAGAALLWSGIQGKSWTAVLSALLTGKDPSTLPSTTAISVSGDGSATPSTGGTPSSNAQGGNVGENQAIAKQLAASYGWDSGSQWDDLVKLWTKESSWSNTAENPSSAYGIPQALPPTKMPKAAQPPKLGGSSNAGAQITWGLSYIKQRYGSPSAAWAHETSAGWY